MGRRSLLRAIGPGLVVAATGVGAGDLATSAFAGSHLGLAVLWAVIAGALLKYALTEGLARYQLATGETVLEGVLLRAPRPARALFLLYLLPWTWFVGSALVSACGVTAHALFPVFESATRAKVAFGIVHALAGLALVWRGGYRMLERVLSVAIALMSVAVVVTALCLGPDAGAVLRGLVVPSVPEAGGSGAAWTVALLGGVGGTLTILCYGYWIREEGREGAAELAVCRVDLAAGYLVTALFGVAMVVIGSTIEIEGSGAGLIVALADRLEGPLGRTGRLAFLVGAWGAVFTSLLGVWQSVPYVFADVWRTLAGSDAAAVRERAVDTRSAPYRAYLVAIATVPLLGLGVSFERAQKAYAVVGALFLPLLAVALLALNGRASVVGRHRNGPASTAALLAALALFGWLAWRELAA